MPWKRQEEGDRDVLCVASTPVNPLCPSPSDGRPSAFTSIHNIHLQTPPGPFVLARLPGCSNASTLSTVHKAAGSSVPRA